MPGRAENSDQYRYSFNTQEKVDEISGEGNHTTALYWEYDTRLGRRWNIDPITYPWQSSYATFNGNPIVYTDPDGLYGRRKASRKSRRDQRKGFDTGKVYNSGGGKKDYGFATNNTSDGNYAHDFGKGSKSANGNYSANNLAVRNQVLDMGGVLASGIRANESKGIYRDNLYDSSSPYGEGFKSNWSQGYSGLSDDTKFLMKGAAYGIGGTLGLTLGVPALIEGSALFTTTAYDGALTGAAHIYFRWQMYTGTVSGLGSSGILLGRGMQSFVIPTANRLGLGYLQMPRFIQLGSRTMPMMHYNRIWLQFHLQRGTPVNIMTNAVSPLFKPSPFMDMELRMLMQYYGGK